MKIKIIKSRKRKKILTACYDGITLTINSPAYLTKPVLRQQAKLLENKIRAAEEAKINHLRTRAENLNQRYFQGQALLNTIKFSARQNKRYGSCTPKRRTIRLSYQLLHMPAWVLDYVIVHELAHLLEPNHSKQFWQLVNQYPYTEKARGYLQAHAKYSLSSSN